MQREGGFLLYYIVIFVGLRYLQNTMPMSSFRSTRNLHESDPKHFCLNHGFAKFGTFGYTIRIKEHPMVKCK